MKTFTDHELVFLGTGGGRIHSATQYRSTGGIIYFFNDSQIHIDPGPGAIVQLNKMGIDRHKTKWIVVTHNHTDHQNDTPIIIESLHKSLNIPAGILISTEDFIQSLNPYYKSLLLEIISMKAGKRIQLSPHTIMEGTKVRHGHMEGFGFIIHQSNPNNISQSYQIGFTSDTEIYENFKEIYKRVDILVANVLRPKDISCNRHACVDEILPALKIVQPKITILTHFGALFDSPSSNGKLIEQQVEYMQKELGNTTQIIAAQDGMHIKISELLQD